MNNSVQNDIEKPINGEVVKNEQKPTELVKSFRPTPHMILWLEKSMELGFGATVSEISKQSNVDRTNWYMWIRKPEFVEWWNTQWQQYIRAVRHKLSLIGLKKAESDYTYWKDMMTVTGNIQPEGPAMISPTQINVNLDKYIK